MSAQRGTNKFSKTRLLRNYMNSQIILADVKLTNSERQVRDGGRRSEERCMVLIDNYQTQTGGVEKIGII